jgi:hypothetical protein
MLNLKVKKNINKTLVNSGVVSPLMDSTIFRPFDIISKSIQDTGGVYENLIKQ